MSKMKSHIDLVCFSMGKAFPVRKIATDIQEANKFMEKHSDTGVIAEHDGKIFIADLYGATVPSSTIKSLF